MSNRTILMVLLAAMLALTAPPALAAEKCPMDAASCLDAYAKMRERPWLGVEVDIDSAGTIRVLRVLDDTPAKRAGIRPGDVLQRFDGKPTREWFAGRSGWKEHGTAVCTVLRDDRPRDLKLELLRIPDDVFARMIGTHMIESHLAYAEGADDHTH